VTLNGNAALAQSTAAGSSGQAQATAQTNFGGFNSVGATATSPVLTSTFTVTATPANAIAQAGGSISLSNPINPGQSFSVVSGGSVGPLTLASGAMGAGYGGTGTPLTYQESASFTQNGGFFLLDLLSDNSLGTGFDSALFEISLNGTIVDSESFTDLASADAFFDNNLINVDLGTGPNDVQILFSETMGSSVGQGFSFDYAIGSVATPLPSTLPFFATGLGGLGLLGWRRKRKARALA
jgi:hypothetical protein